LRRDPEALIRTNALVCTSKLADTIGGVFKQSLLPMCVAALKDDVAACRIIAVNTIASTLQQYTPQDIAGRIIPTLSPLLLDSEPQVRTAVSTAIQVMMKNVEAAMVAQASSTENGANDASAAQSQPITTSEVSNKSLVCMFKFYFPIHAICCFRVGQYPVH
jgi:hypothetical protein